MEINVESGLLETGAWKFNGNNLIKRNFAHTLSIEISSIKSIKILEERKDILNRKSIRFLATLTNEGEFYAESSQADLEKFISIAKSTNKTEMRITKTINKEAIGAAIGMLIGIYFAIIRPIMQLHEPSDTASDNPSIQHHQICKAGIATIMGRDPSIITPSNISGPIIGLSYIRNNDGTKWSYKCKVAGNTIIWGNSDGRWREDPLDGVVTYKVVGDSVVVSERHTDGSETVKEFGLKSL